MKKQWIAFAARRYFRTKRREKGFTSSLLSVMGIAVGVMTLVSVLAVMNGFQLSFIEDILEISSYHLRLESPQGLELTPEQERKILSLPGVRSMLPFYDSQTIVKGPFSSLRGAFVRGVSLDALERDSGLEAHAELLEGQWDLSSGNRIVLGSELARSLGVQSGDSVTLMALTGENFSVLKPEEVEFQVAAIFKSGYYDFDTAWAFISLDKARQYFARPSDLRYGIKLHDYFQDRNTLQALAPVITDGHRAVSWREYNAAFFGALRMEKLTMMLLIGLIFLVVGVNIFHSIKRSVIERQEDIGLFKAVGARPGDVRIMFALEGVFVGVVGALIGVLLGLFLSDNINTFFSFLETALNTLVAWFSPGKTDAAVALYSGGFFYIPRIPSRVLFSEVLLIVLFAVFSATGAAWLASRKIIKIKPAEVLRAE